MCRLSNVAEYQESGDVGIGLTPLRPKKSRFFHSRLGFPLDYPPSIMLANLSERDSVPFNILKLYEIYSHRPQQEGCLE